MTAPNIKGIILMAGHGMRFDSPLPKQFHRIAGKRIYLYTLEKFLAIPLFNTIFLVAPAHWIDQVKNEIASYQNPKLKIILGGGSRQESSFLALQACGQDTDYVVIHDGVRPFISTEILYQNIEKVQEHLAVDTCIPSLDTVVQKINTPLSYQVQNIPPRSAYWRGQTPQSFHYPLILQAHQKAQAQLDSPQEISDDCGLVLRLGHPVHMVLGAEENIKITTELDLYVAEQILRQQHLAMPLPHSQEISLEGKKIAITGSSGGIGSAIAEALQNAKAIPLLISRNEGPYRADCTSFSEVAQVFQKIYEEHGPIDGLINSFGLLKIKEVFDLSSEEIDELVACNFTGVIYCCKSAHIRPGGHIINIASSSYARGRQGYAIYAGAKAAIVNFTQGLSEERCDLHINALVPQRTNTVMRQLNFPKENPIDRLDPQEIAVAAISLLKTKNLTGSTIEVRNLYRDRFKCDMLKCDPKLLSTLQHE